MKLTEMQIMKVIHEFEKHIDSCKQFVVRTVNTIQSEQKYFNDKFIFMTLMSNITEGIADILNAEVVVKRNLHFKFMFNNTLHSIVFIEQPGNPYKICCVEIRKDKWDQFPKKILMSEFIFKHCNPEGALLIEQIMFRDIV